MSFLRLCLVYVQSQCRCSSHNELCLMQTKMLCSKCQCAGEATAKEKETTVRTEHSTSSSIADGTTPYQTVAACCQKLIIVLVYPYPQPNPEVKPSSLGYTHAHAQSIASSASLIIVIQVPVNISLYKVLPGLL